MASDLAPNKVVPKFDAVPAGLLKREPSATATLRKVLMPLASLKLTVALLAMGILLVLFGTLAQTRIDIWEVMAEYFRAWVVWVPFEIFFPPAFFSPAEHAWARNIPGGFFFPGGVVIGGLMFINLIAAHGLRFTVQARGVRLGWGLATIALGVVVTWLVVVAGSDKDVTVAAGNIWDFLWVWSYARIWTWMKVSIFAIWVGIFYTLTRLDRSQKWERIILGSFVLAIGVLLVWLFYMGDRAMLSDASMRIFWQLMKATFAGLVLLAGCLLLFRKRAGIVLLHSGIGLMMANELVVYSLHSEAQMQLAEGQTTNYVQDIRSVELAIVEPSTDDKTETNIVVPKQLLVPGKLVKSDELPFDIELDKYFQNAEVRAAGPMEKNPATAGSGKSLLAEGRRAGTGTDVGGSVDVPAGYFNFYKKGESKPFGTYLMSLLLNPQSIEVDGKTYEVLLRYKRSYRPYHVTLLDVRKDDYMGTNMPKNYSSDVHIVDPTREMDRDVKIWMNNPLRFAGETFYQSSYHYDDKSNREFTTISVVKNAGWMIPYVACMLVAIGMIAHFIIALTRFLRRRDEHDLALDRPAGSQSTDVQLWAHVELVGDSKLRLAGVIASVAVVLLCAAVLGKAMRTPRVADGEMDLYAFGKLPVVFGGREKPIDSMARNSLVMLSNRQSFHIEKEEKDADGKDVTVKTQHSAVRWLLDVATDRKAAFSYKVFRIENLELLDMLGLTRRSGFLYALEEFRDKFDAFEREAGLAHKVQRADKDNLSTYQKQVLALEARVQLYLKLSAALEPDVQRLDQQDKLIAMEPPLLVPPAKEGGKWEPYSTAWTNDMVLELMEKHPEQIPNPAAREMFAQRKPSEAVKLLSPIFDAYQKKDAAAFNAAVTSYQSWLEKNTPQETNFTKLNFEAFFNNFDPFFYATFLYLFAFCLTAIGWVPGARPLRTAAFWLLVFLFVVHTAALIGRIYISGRPPVTNLYSSAIFIGWVCVVAGLLLEIVFRLGIGNAVAAVAGFATLLIAFFLARSGDTIVVLQAVLDTQIWLSTHVVCITIGYAVTYLAGLLGIIYIFYAAGKFLADRFSGPNPDDRFSPMLLKVIASVIYGTVCFAMFFSFVGTVLGGLWADDSWGRFWGWDPKENGALIIVLWNALILHARWGGMVRDRGLAALAVVGNIVTSWSWFGVNELGVGLHSYGFTDGVVQALSWAIFINLVIVAIGAFTPRVRLPDPQAS